MIVLEEEHNATSLTDVVALTGCARSSLGICASSSGAIAGCLLWQVGWCYTIFLPKPCIPPTEK